jgi:hypothetical protein
MVSQIATSNQIRVHQALHGYADGHRLLATSREEIKGRDAKTMLILSDASGPGMRAAEHGYLTGYPLTDSGYYALARTWSAPEMPRPGCVWTHTLLIEFADLASLESFDKLLELFVRPTEAASHSDYSRPLEVDRTPTAPPMGGGLSDFYLAILRALYLEPMSRILIPRSLTPTEEGAILAIWVQQWPKLRRSFRFCTFSASDRSTAADGFDLQFVAVGRSGRRISSEGESTPAEMLEGLRLAVEDLIHPKDDFRAFLRAAGMDVEGGRAAFAPLTYLFGVLFDRISSTDGLNGAVELAKHTFKGDQGKLVRRLLVEKALGCLPVLGPVALEYVADELEYLSPELRESRTSDVGLRILNDFPPRFFSMLNETGWRQAMAHITLSKLPVAAVLGLLPNAGEAAAAIVTQRPDALQSSSIWESASTYAQRSLLAICDSAGVSWNKVLPAIVRSGAIAIAEDAIRMAGESTVLAVLTEYFDSADAEIVSQSERTWLRLAVKDVAKLAVHLSGAGIRRRSTLGLIAQEITPLGVPNQFGEDPWLIALRGATGRTTTALGLFFSAYIFVRALGHVSRSQGELIGSVFDDLYDSAKHSALPHDAWYLLEPVLPNSSFWFEWDRCQRLRAAVCSAFVERNLSVDLFLAVTRDDATFSELVLNMSIRSVGRSYLRYVLQTSMRAGNSNLYRLELIRNAVDR